MTGKGKKPAQIVFADWMRPGLTAGTYTLAVTQNLSGVPREELADPRLTSALSFEIDGPRYLLAPGDVQSVYPGDASSGDYGDSLPHVVFRRPTLPWERLPAFTASLPVGTETHYPWLGLLVIDEADVPKITEKVGEVVEYGKTASAISVEIPAEVWDRVRPSLDDLPLTAHVRKVEPQAKEDVPGVGDGAFAVVIGNRKPEPGKSTTVLLVSWAELEKSAFTADAQGAVVLPLLFRWSFRTAAAALAQKIAALGQSGFWPVCPSVGDGGVVDKALALGFVPVRHERRFGDTGVSWYRGPLVPWEMRLEGPALYDSPDAAASFDPATGMYNIAYAAAHQLGQLLALQAPGLARALYHFEQGEVVKRMVGVARKRREVIDAELNPALKTRVVVKNARMDEGEEIGLVLRDDLLMGIVADALNLIEQPDAASRQEAGQ